MARQSRVVQLLDTDLVTYLGTLADQIRTDSMAIAGMARPEAGEMPEPRTLIVLANSFNDKADCLVTAAKLLCPHCRIHPIVQIIKFGKGPGRGRRGRSHGRRAT